jgi:hypothetical protein
MIQEASLQSRWRGCPDCGSNYSDPELHLEPSGYKEFTRVRIPAKMTVTWRLKEGDFTWLNLTISEIHYNKVSKD